MKPEIFSARNKHPLLEGGQLALTIPETPNHPNQEYVRKSKDIKGQTQG